MGGGDGAKLCIDLVLSHVIIKYPICILERLEKCTLQRILKSFFKNEKESCIYVYKYIYKKKNLGDRDTSLIQGFFFL